MKKDDFIKALAKNCGITGALANKFVNAYADLVIKALNEDKGEAILFPFGKFEKVLRKKRGGFNPHTLEKIEIPEKNAIVFRPGKKTKREIS